MNLKQIVALVVGWQLFCVVATLVGLSFLPSKVNYRQNSLILSRANFDGGHYLGIARNGYGYNEQTFFPLYPSLIKKLSQGIDMHLAGIGLSLFCFVAAIFFLVKLTALDYKREVVLWTVMALVVFPTSFYFGLVYTESLFLLLIVSSFYFARKSNWWLAGLLGALAAYARFEGVFLLLPLLIEWGSQKGRSIKNLLPIMMVSLGLAAYMLFLQKTSGDPLAFLHTKPPPGIVQSDKMVMLYQVFWRYSKMIFMVDKGTALYSQVLLEAAVGLLFCILTIYSFIKLRVSYAIFALTIYLVPTLTGSFVSLPRFVLSCFPAFIILGRALAKYRLLRLTYLFICLLALFLWAALFSAGYWVA